MMRCSVVAAILLIAGAIQAHASVKPIDGDSFRMLGPLADVDHFSGRSSPIKARSGGVSGIRIRSSVLSLAPNRFGLPALVNI